MKSGKNFKVIPLLIVLQVFYVAFGKTYENESMNPRSLRMEIERFETYAKTGKVEAFKVWDSISDKKDVMPVAFRLLRNPDSGTRDIAAHCLSSIYNSSVTAAFVEALKDPSNEVRGTVYAYLDANADKSALPELIKNFKNYDVDIRIGVALIIGRLGDSSIIQNCRDAYEKENNVKCKRNIGLAMAKLGDRQLKDFFAQPLLNGNSDQHYQAICDLAYIDDMHMVKTLLSALDNMQNAYLISLLDQNPQRYARVCDAAVNLSAKWFPKAYSFPVDHYKNYSTEELLEVKKNLLSR
jgi:hypothetical protein